MSDTTGRYVGLWFGGSSYSPGEWFTDAEIFDTIEQAKRVLSDRYNLGYVWDDKDIPCEAVWTESPYGEQSFATKGEQGENLRCPAVSLECELWLAPRDRTSLQDCESDPLMVVTHVLTLGSKGGVRVNV